MRSKAGAFSRSITEGVSIARLSVKNRMARVGFARLSDVQARSGEKQEFVAAEGADTDERDRIHLPLFLCEVAETQIGNSTWVKVSYQGVEGWVSKRFLARQ